MKTFEYIVLLSTFVYFSQFVVCTKITKSRCCSAGREFAKNHQHYQEFIPLNQLNLDIHKDNYALSEKRNLDNFFKSINLSKHFQLNSTTCIYPITNELITSEKSYRRDSLLIECENEFKKCCLDEQQLFALGVDLALKAKFQQQNTIENKSPREIKKLQYKIETGEMVRTKCDLLNKDKNPNLSLGQNIALDCCEACAFGMNSMDRFENCNLNNQPVYKKNVLLDAISKQCCRINMLSKIAENQGLIKYVSNLTYY